ncbi:MAG TPA: hypothetical protein VN660_08400 [Steroidobacteraceae bacterium]|nr:hypothetical protein [Steroidobacteraceae bacterium]
MGARLIALALLLVAAPVWAQQGIDGFEAGIDLRAVAASGARSFLDGGLGDLRFDPQHSGARLDSVWLDYNGSLHDVVHFVADAVAYADGDRYPLDLTQAFAEWRPYPLGVWRSRLKVGAFYAPISFENWLVGWRSPYTLSYSAIDTWVGEELRTIGGEYDLDWLGRQRGHAWQLGVTASLYGWNNPAGTLLALRGWALHDRQTTLFGRIGTPGTGFVRGLREFYGNFGGGPGYYVGANAKHRGDLELRVLHYDNLTDPSRYSPALDNHAWHTVFDSAGGSWTPTPRWTVISQWLGGDTCASPALACYQFNSAYLLASWQRGADRLTARYDGFQMHSYSGPYANRNRGHAWTFAYQRELNSHLSVALEELRMVSSLASRRFVGEPQGLAENELQLALRAQL